MTALDTKLVRDLRHVWAQVLAVSLVLAAAVATLIMSAGSSRSLYETRETYYDRYQFADIFAAAKKIPKHLLLKVAEIEGVAMAEGRVGKFALLDLPGVAEPATGYISSLPDNREPFLNRLYMRSGRIPDTGSTEAIIDEAFAQANGFAPGDRFSAILNGRKRDLTVVGIAMSPEFIYAIGPGDFMPNPRRFGAIWMSEKTLATAYGLEGAYSALSVRLSRGASEAEVIKQLDLLLDPYGGQAAYGRKDQVSHAFLDHELDMLANMSRTLPPIFLLVAAFLVNITTSRIVALDQEQIGLLKAVGYPGRTIVLHYLKLVSVMALIGLVLGSVAGTWLGSFITRLFGEFFRFPFLVFNWPPGVYVLAAVLSMAAALMGAAFALRRVSLLTPSAAMQPPTPPIYRRVLPLWGLHLLSAPTTMALRNMSRHPLRTLFTCVGMALATAILVVSLFTRETMEQLIDVTYFLADRQDATLSFADKLSSTSALEVRRLPGVIVAEAGRQLPVRIRHANVERRIVVTARNPGADLNRIIDVDLHPVALPGSGIAISSLLGTILGVSVGDEVEIDVLEGRRRTLSVPVEALIEDYFGIRGVMSESSLAAVLREAPAVNTVSVSLDKARLLDFYEAVKRIPVISAVGLQWASLEKFRQTLAVLITTMASIYTGLASIIAFGVVYNSARISLSERSRELASLRVLGFTQVEVLRILLLELGLLTIAAQVPGWIMGYGLAWVMRNNLAGELMRVRLVVENSTYAIATAVVLAAAMASALVVRARVSNLDLVAVLKTRD